MNFRFTSLIASLLFFGFSPVRGHGSEFAWKNYVGENPSKLFNDLKGIANCRPAEPLNYTLKPDTKHITQSNFSNWYAPSGGGLILDREFLSNTINTLECRIGDSVEIQTMQFKERLVSLKVNYQRCELKDLECVIKKSEIDDNAYHLLESLLVVVPWIGSGEISSDEFDKFQQYKLDLKSKRPVSPSALNDDGCFYPTLNNTKWRCLVGSRQFDAVLQHFSFAEIDNSTLFVKLKDHILMSQEFVDPELEEKMQISFIQEINQQIDHLNAIDSSLKDKKDISKKIIQTLQ